MMLPHIECFRQCNGVKEEQGEGLSFCGRQATGQKRGKLNERAQLVDPLGRQREASILSDTQNHGGCNVALDWISGKELPVTCTFDLCKAN